MTRRSRAGVPDDAAAIAAIYNQGIDDRLATFETRHRTPDEVRTWFDGSKVIVVIEDGGIVVASAWTSPTSGRCAYEKNAEASVYVDRSTRGSGAGTASLDALIDRARSAGMWKLLAGIFPENEPSLRLFHRLGFRDVGRHEDHAELDGVFRDVVVLERIIGR